ncbi:MAG: hypothetical protein RLZZ344_1783 [Pseudomonadota bacterium]|jgi:nucleoside-diphosphate-sugar epimerase
MIGALPARFRQPRIGLVGFGDIGRRILSQRVKAATTTTCGILPARLVCVARGLARPAATAEDPEQAILLGRDLKARRSLAGRQIVLLGWDLDSPEACQRLARVLTHWVVLFPPGESHTQPHERHLADHPAAGAKVPRPRDIRSRRLAMALAISQGVRGLRRGPSARGLYISTTGVYGDHHGARIHETGRCLTRQPRSLRRLDAESVWRGLGFHVLRVPGITTEETLPVDRIKAGARMLRAEDDIFTNHIHADDLAEICWKAIWRGRRGRLTNAVCGGSMPLGDYYDTVADAARLPRPPRLSRSAWTEAVARGDISPMTASFMQDSRRVESRRLANELKVRLRYPTIADIVRARFG